MKEMIMVEVKNGSYSRATARGCGDLVWGGGENDGDIPFLNESREVCKMWKTVQKFVEKHHPS
jgi:hypothetical protein